ncbi:MAG: efflux RND transporter periplasmic adaptor subunit [Pseudomonadota bacterium]|nr:efflux RND transporter periplasmic adaptor subunit [Pseudomonadota bacterium]
MHRTPILNRFALTALLASLAACSQPADSQGANAASTQAAPPPPEVVVVVVQRQPVERSIELSGRLRAYQIAEVRPQASGIIQKRLFDEGAYVKAGQALYQIDAATYQTAVSSAEAALRRQKANLSALQTTARRYRELVRSDAVSKQEYDDIMAQIALAEADIAASQANLDNSKINLDYAVVRAPISGQSGTSSVTAGALVTANQAAPMVTIQQLDPLYVDITQSSAEMLRLREQITSGNLSRNGITEVRLTLPDDREYPLAGRLQFSNASVDETSGSVTLRAVVDNPNNLLLPGMYVKAKVSQGTLPDAILVPQQALTRNPQGDATVLVVAKDNTVSQRVVQAAFTQGNQWVVTDGLETGERLIVQGSQKIRLMPGMPAPVVSPKLSPDASPAATSDAAPTSNASVESAATNAATAEPANAQS